MRPTELVYSSHDRSGYLHGEWIVRRALEGTENRTVFYLPFSSGARGDQEYSWGTFAGYLEGFRPAGLSPRTFFWSEELRREDAQAFFGLLRESQVVILGGGRTSTGLQRYAEMGGRFFGNPRAFEETLRDRQARGMLTAGFSAGADQLCQYSGDDSSPCLGLVERVVTTLHFSPGAEGRIAYLAGRHPDCLVFGLPNDSGLAVNQGRTPGGRFCQLIQFITDSSWDRPEDHHHIKTRQGVKIEHRYLDGRDWQFNGGDLLLRLVHGDGFHQEAWIKRPEMPFFIDYWTRQETGYRTAEEILGGR